MIELKQCVHNLLGSKDAIKNLSEKQSARILVISDSHRNVDVFSDILKDYGNSCDALVFCGDGIGDLVKMLNHAALYDDERDFIPPVVAFVQGNGDPSIVTCDFDPTVDNPTTDDIFDEPNPKHDDEKSLGRPLRQYYQLLVPKRQTLLAAGKKILISHGHLHGVDYSDTLFISEAKMAGCQIILHGHTHIARDETKDSGLRIINPGSPSRPRGGTPPGFAILTIQGNIVDTAFIKITNKGYEFYTPLN